MTRKELYTKVKELHLENDIRELTGRNYTQVSNEVLEDFLPTLSEIEEVKEQGKAMVEFKVDDTKDEGKLLLFLFTALKTLVLDLKKKHILLGSGWDWADNLQMER